MGLGVEGWCRGEEGGVREGWEGVEWWGRRRGLG